MFLAKRLCRLDNDDADFVDIIHTAGKWVGTNEDMGHVDFFPNLGEAPQPGCKGRESIDLSCSHFMVRKILCCSFSCCCSCCCCFCCCMFLFNHDTDPKYIIVILIQSWKVFSESIRGSTFYALSCPSKEEYLSGKCCSSLKDYSNTTGTSPKITLMGLNVDQSARGRYFLRTDGSQPADTKAKSLGCAWVPDYG